MLTTYHNNARGGHCPGQIRDTFLAALEAFVAWNDGEPEPTVDWFDDTISISRAAGMVWNCSDILPRSALFSIELSALDRCGPIHTYAHGARALRQAMNRSSRATDRHVH